MKVRNPIVVIALITAVSSVANAAPLIWRSTATGGANWSDAANWNPAQMPVAGDSFTFPTPVAGGIRTTNNDLAAGTQINGITASAGAYILGGNAINLGGNYAFTSATASAINSVALPVTLLQTTDINVVGVASGTQPRIEWGGVIDGNFGINKIGTGTLRLQTAAKNYTGNTLVSAGAIDLNFDNVLPFGAGKGDLAIDAGATVLNINTNWNINGLNNGPNGAGQITRSGTNTRGFTIGNGDASGNFSGNITSTGGSSSITKTGTGTQTLGGTVTTAGTSTINGGRLNVDGTFAAGLTAAAAGALGGTGAINGLITNNGKLEPGVLNGTAVLAAGSMTLGAAGTTTLDIDGLLRESQYDGLDVTGALAYGGTLSFDFGSTLPAGGLFDAFAFGATVPTGSFTAVNLTGAYAGTLTNDGAGIWTGNGGGTTFVFTQATGDLLVIVPEPMTLLSLTASVGLFVRRRR